jgi:prepilin peptidase CpaA
MPDAAHLIQTFAIFAFTAALVAAALSDAASYLIPNRYPVAVAVAFFAYCSDQPASTFLYGAVVAAGVFAAGVLLFERGMLGGGDVKLLTASAAWAGFDQLVLLLFVTSICGGLLALMRLSPLQFLSPAHTDGASLGSDLRSKLRERIPYGVAIAIGGIAVALARFSA